MMSSQSSMCASLMPCPDEPEARALTHGGRGGKECSTQRPVQKRTHRTDHTQRHRTDRRVPVRAAFLGVQLLEKLRVRQVRDQFPRRKELHRKDSRQHNARDDRVECEAEDANGDRVRARRRGEQGGVAGPWRRIGEDEFGRVDDPRALGAVGAFLSDEVEAALGAEPVALTEDQEDLFLVLRVVERGPPPGACSEVVASSLTFLIGIGDFRMSWSLMPARRSLSSANRLELSATLTRSVPLSIRTRVCRASSGGISSFHRLDIGPASRWSCWSCKAAAVIG